MKLFARIEDIEIYCDPENLKYFEFRSNDESWDVVVSKELEAAWQASLYEPPQDPLSSMLQWLVKTTRPKLLPTRPPAREARKKFIDALEDTFWEADGPSKLLKLAEQNPLEFLKICAKLIPANVADKTPAGGLSINFNLDNTKQLEDCSIIEYDDS